MKSYYYCIIFLIVPLFTYGQQTQITGTILQSPNNEPLAHLDVSINNSSYLTKTDQSGKFTFYLGSNPDTIYFDAFKGYVVQKMKRKNRDYTLYLIGSEPLDLMQLSIDEIMQIKVQSVAKFEQSYRDVQASVLIIDKKDIANYGYGTVSELLDNIPGFYKINDLKEYNYGVRGYFSNVYNRNIVVLINGVDQKILPQNRNSFINFGIQPENIERIEVVKGPIAVTYGGDAFFGAINIITDKSENSQVVTTIGNNNSYKLSTHVNWEGEDGHYSIIASRSTTDGYAYPVNRMWDSIIDVNGNWHANNIQQHFLYSNKTNITLQGKIKGFTSQLSVNHAENGSVFIFAPVKDNPVTTKLLVVRSSLGYQHKLTKWMDLTIRHFYTFNNSNTDYSYTAISPFLVESGDARTESNTQNIEAFFTYHKKEKYTLSAGGRYLYCDYATEDIDAPPLPLSRANRLYNSILTPYQIFSGFFQSTVHLGPSISLSMGARIEKEFPYTIQSKYRDPFSYDTIQISPTVQSLVNKHVVMKYKTNDIKARLIPQVGIIYKRSEYSILKLLYSEADGRPSISDRFGVTDSINDQHIKTVEVNFTSKLNNSIFLNTSVYYNRLRQLIIREEFIDPVSGRLVNRRNNSGKMYSMGLESKVNVSLTSNLHFNLNISYQYTRNIKYGIDAAYSPKLQLHFNGVYKITPNIKLGSSTYYIDSMYPYWGVLRADTEMAKAGELGYISNKIPGYTNTMVNLRFDNLFSKNIFITIHVNNIFKNPRYYPPTTLNYTYMPNGGFEQGIDLMVSTGIKF